MPIAMKFRQLKRLHAHSFEHLLESGRPGLAGVLVNSKRRVHMAGKCDAAFERLVFVAVSVTFDLFQRNFGALAAEVNEHAHPLNFADRRVKPGDILPLMSFTSSWILPQAEAPKAKLGELEIDRIIPRKEKGMGRR